jgi:hypothetical protein
MRKASGRYDALQYWLHCQGKHDSFAVRASARFTTANTIGVIQPLVHAAIWVFSSFTPSSTAGTYLCSSSNLERYACVQNYTVGAGY